MITSLICLAAVHFQASQGFTHLPFRPTQSSGDRVYLVDIHSTWTPSSRASAVGQSVTPVVCAQARVLGSNQATNLAEVTLVSLGGKTSRADTSLRGRYLATLYTPNSQGQLEGGCFAREGDVFLASAFRVDEFEIRAGELPEVAYFRALLAGASAISPKEIEARLKYMPILDPHNSKSFQASFTEAAAAIFQLARDLPPTKALPILVDLKRWRFRPVEAPIVEAVWSARNDSSIDEIGLEFDLLDEGMRGPTDFHVDNVDFIGKAEQSERDNARAFFVRNLSGTGFDGRRLARLLLESGSKTKYEVVRQLGLQSNNPALHIQDVPPEKRQEEVDRLVAFWKKHFGL